MEPEYDFYFKTDLRPFKSLVLHEFAVLRCPSGYILPLKEPSAYAVYIVLQGKGVYAVSGKEFPASEGDCFVLYPGTRIKCAADKKDPWALVMVNFDGADAKFILETAKFSPEKPLHHHKEHITNEVIQLISGFYRFRGGDIYHAIASTAMLYLLLGFLVKNQENPVSVSIPSNWASAAHFNKARDFIMENYSRNITIGDIASHVGLSRSRLYRIFLQQASVSPHQYLTEIRVQEAHDLLKKHGSTIGDIARAVGIENPLYFSTLFKRFTGETPSGFMKKTGSDPEKEIKT
jgi:AraC-like DNA-binding protein